MILVIGRTERGTFSQVCATRERAAEWMRRMSEISQRDVEWSTHEVEATSVNQAIVEITRRAQ